MSGSTESINPSSSLVVFSHGKESGPWGSKIRALATIATSKGFSVESVNYADLVDPELRVERLQATPLPPHGRLILVGSSMGGYVSTVCSEALKPTGLFLMAPALYLPGYRTQDPSPCAGRTSVVHGWNDDVVPVEHSIRFARRYRAALHILDADHRLNSTLASLCMIFSNFLDEIAAS